jgi:hypothetical protein
VIKVPWFNKFVSFLGMQETIDECLRDTTEKNAAFRTFLGIERLSLRNKPHRCVQLCQRAEDTFTHQGFKLSQSFSCDGFIEIVGSVVVKRHGRFNISLHHQDRPSFQKGIARWILPEGSFPFLDRLPLDREEAGTISHRHDITKNIQITSLVHNWAQLGSPCCSIY